MKLADRINFQDEKILGRTDMLLWSTVLIWILYSLLNTAVSIFYIVDSGITFSYTTEFLWHFLYNLPLLVLVPAVVLLAQRFRLDEGPKPRIILLHLLAAFLFVLIYSLLNSILLTIRFGTDITVNFLLVNFLYYLDIRLFLYGLILLGYYAIYYHHKTNTEYHRELILKEKIGRARLDTLKKEMQPGFLLNVISEMRSEIFQSPEKIDTLIVHTADIVRKLLDNSKDEYVVLGKDAELLRKYVELLKYRNDQNVQFDQNMECVRQKLRISPALVIMGIAEDFISSSDSFWKGVDRLRYETRELDKDIFNVIIEVHNPRISQQKFESWYAGAGWENIIGPLQQSLSEEESVNVRYMESVNLTLSLTLKKEQDDRFAKT